jgi:group I intron endonuclease
MATVYQITCTVTGKVYIGWTTCSLTARWKRHLRGDRSCYLQSCFRKYGKEHFVIKPLHTFRRNADAITKEMQLIRNLKLNISRYPRGAGMNMTDGGEGTVGRTISEVHKQKLSLALKGRKKTPEHREKIRLAKQGRNNPMYGKSPNAQQLEGARRRFTENNPHKPGVLNHRRGKPSHMRGRKHSEETKARIRNKLRGNRRGPRDPATKEKLSRALRAHWLNHRHPGLGSKGDCVFHKPTTIPSGENGLSPVTRPA